MKREEGHRLGLGVCATLRVLRAETRLTVYRSCAIAKPGRLGPAKNDETPPQNDRVSKVLIDAAHEVVKKTMSSVYGRLR